MEREGCVWTLLNLEGKLRDANSLILNKHANNRQGCHLYLIDKNIFKIAKNEWDMRQEGCVWAQLNPKVSQGLPTLQVFAKIGRVAIHI